MSIRALPVPPPANDHPDLPDAPLPLPKSSGDGTSDGMDPWQQTVETRLGELRTDVGALKVDVAVIKERIGNLPSKGYIVSVVSAGFALLAAVTLFGPNLRTLFGLS